MSENEKKQPINRRDLLKSIATVPFLGAMFYGLYRKKKYEDYIRGNLADELNLNYEPPEVYQYKPQSSDKPLRIGIIGNGSRGSHLLRSAGFVHPDKIRSWKEALSKNKNDNRYQDFIQQEDLNVEITAVCDIFDVHARQALEAGANRERKDTLAADAKMAVRCMNYKELLARDDVDAVIIATPDHWHAPMAIEAANAGKHIYVEKPMTHKLSEVYALRDAVKKNGIILQLGHQGRQTESFNKAIEVIKKNILGKISLVEVCTNRNDPNGAWVYPIHPEASEKTIDWQQFLGNAPSVPFSAERFFRWRCWWDYATGLSGDLFTHEFDAINQVLNLGIPSSVTASGGIYFYKDGREVPDVLQIVCEYPEHDLSLLYSATLSSERNRGKIFMGHDGHMELSDKLIVKTDPNSTRYKKQIDKKIIDPTIPIYTYTPGMKQVDAITSATEQYFASRGLLYTFRDGKRFDTTFLHIKEWIQCIRTNSKPSCDIDAGFEEAITAAMADISYKEKKQVFWDKDNEKVVY